MDDRIERIPLRADDRCRSDRDHTPGERAKGGRPSTHPDRTRHAAIVWDFRYPADLMNRPRRSIRGFAVAVAIALIAGCSPTSPTPTPTTTAVTTDSPAPSGSSSSPSPSAATYQVPPAHWTDCGNGFLCAEIRVPRDYNVPSSGYLNLSIVRLPATDPKHRIGSIVVNPGGPGASGVDFVRQDAEAFFSTAMRKRFDIVGFDPRGVNASSPIRCIDNLDPLARLDPSPDDPAELKALVDSARSYAHQCGARNDATLPYLSTDAVARDLDLIREAIGEKQITYVGFSYGTLIGALYADLYPQHIRAMVLDGAIDPTLDLEALRSGQANGFEHALRTSSPTAPPRLRVRSTRMATARGRSIR